MTPFTVTAGERTPWDGLGGAATIVGTWLSRVRVTGDPRAAAELMASEIVCHQVISEERTTIVRSPSDYAEHVQDMTASYGDFTYTVTEFLAGLEKVYVRWEQRGRDLARPDGEAGTGGEVLEVGSAVYRVDSGRIVEYWVQLDRWGLAEQLSRLDATHLDPGS